MKKTNERTRNALDFAKVQLSLGFERAVILQGLQRDFSYNQIRSQKVLEKAAQIIRDEHGIEALPETGQSIIRLKLILSKCIKMGDTKTALACELRIQELHQKRFIKDEINSPVNDAPETEEHAPGRAKGKLNDLYDLIDELFDEHMKNDFESSYEVLLRNVKNRLDELEKYKRENKNKKTKKQSR